MNEDKKYYYQKGNDFRIELFPLLEIPEGYVEITQEEYEQAQAEIFASLYQKNPLQQKKERIRTLKSFLASSDYKQAKWIDGELTDEEYAPIKTQRHAWRVEINQLEEELENEQ